MPETPGPKIGKRSTPPTGEVTHAVPLDYNDPHAYEQLKITLLGFLKSRERPHGERLRSGVPWPGPNSPPISLDDFAPPICTYPGHGAYKWDIEGFLRAEHENLPGGARGDRLIDQALGDCLSDGLVQAGMVEIYQQHLVEKLQTITVFRITKRGIASLEQGELIDGSPAPEPASNHNSTDTAPLAKEVPQARRRRGRPPVSAEQKQRDKRIVAAWATDGYGTKADCATALGDGFTEKEVREAVDRNRNRNRKKTASE